MLTAYSLGASEMSDIYFVIYSIYTIISPMISIGIWKVYMPSYKEKLVLNKENEALDITSKLLVFFLLISLCIIAVINIFPAYTIFIFAPGFNMSAVDVGIPLLRIISILFFLGIIHTFGSAILQANQQFKKSQSKGVIQHIPTLVYLVIFTNKVTIVGLTLSIVFGEVLSAIVMMCYSKPYYRFRLPNKIFDSETCIILKTIPSACAVSIINQLNGIIDKAFASSLKTGSITCLNYGSKLCYFFDGIFSTAVSTAVFPTLTELLVINDKKKVEEFVGKYLSILSFFIIGVTVYLIAFSNDVVMILFGRGEFDLEAVNLTGLVLLTYSLGLLAMCFNTIVNDVFYIKKATNILLITTVINLALNVFFNALFIKKFGVAGLSLATTASLYITMIIKLAFARRYLIIQKRTFINAFAMIINGVICFVVLSSLSVLLKNVYIKLFIGAVVLSILFVLLAFSFNKFYRGMICEGYNEVRKRIGGKK
jgi:murein biosynthesis integral membrane protein MurJ